MRDMDLKVLNELAKIEPDEPDEPAGLTSVSPETRSKEPETKTVRRTKK